jgi:hypothetical protein
VAKCFLSTIVAAALCACGGSGHGAADDADASDIAGDTGADVEARDAPGAEADDPEAGGDPEDIVGDGDAGDWIVPPSASCAPSADPCALGAAVDGIHATYRKDLWLPGTLVEDMLVEPLMEWYHVWPTHLVAGEPVWFAFHSRDSSWDAAASGNLQIETTAGLAVSGDFPVRATAVPLTYVTTTGDLSALLVHARNLDSVPHTLDRILVDGRDVTGTDVACVPEDTILPGESVLWTVPLCAPASPGDPWTVVVTYTDAAPAVGVGRVMRPSFPVEAWPNSDECPFPGVNDVNFEAMSLAGIDTFFITFGGGGHCGGCDPAGIVGVTAPATESFEVLVADDFLAAAPDPATAIPDTSGTAGFMTGDESDGELYEAGVPRAAGKAAMARELWSLYPEVPVYNGAKTNRNVGTFAGMVDVQGIDFYAAACAPHITRWGTHPPLRGPYDYLRNARNNHAPLPTWMYAQGLHTGWNKSSILTGETIHVQPDPQEILVQALSVAAAGGKGIMWFQVNQEEAAYDPERWDAISRANWMIRGVRSLLREGDVTGMASADGETIVEMVRARNALVVIMLNLAVEHAPTDVACGGGFISELLVPHWILGEQFVDVLVPVPEDIGIVEIFEVERGAVPDPDFGITVEGRVISFQDVHFTDEVPVRLVVLAADEDLRSAVLDAATPPP